MDWTATFIAANRDALRRVLAALRAMAGPEPEDGAPVLPRHLRNAILRLLRPAESATRRLIVMMAQGPISEGEARRLRMGQKLVVTARDIVVTQRPVTTNGTTGITTSATGDNPSSVILGPDPRTHSVRSEPNDKPRRMELIRQHRPLRDLSGMGPLATTALRLSRVKPENDARGLASRQVAGKALPFPLLDPLKDPARRRPRYARAVPRICIPGVTERAPLPPAPRPAIRPATANARPTQSTTSSATATPWPSPPNGATRDDELVRDLAFKIGFKNEAPSPSRAPFLLPWWCEESPA